MWIVPKAIVGSKTIIVAGVPVIEVVGVVVVRTPAMTKCGSRYVHRYLVLGIHFS